MPRNATIEVVPSVTPFMDRISRRALLAGAGAAALGTVGVLSWDELEKLWARLPGADDEGSGAVDQHGARWTPAADGNFRKADRPHDHTIDRVVIHVTQSDFSAAVKTFGDAVNATSAHYVVPAHGGHVAQMVRERDIAYHAGNLAYNERSVGIEHEGFVNRPQDFTDSMYRSSAQVTAGVCKRYRIPVDRDHIIGHVEIPKTDHTDPGRHWDWDRYMRYVRAASSRHAR